MIKKRKYAFLLAGIELIAVILTGLWMIRGIRNLSPVSFDISDWICASTVYHDGAFAVENDLLNNGAETTFLYGPGLPLAKGSYAARIEYEAEQDQYCLASGANTENFLIAPADFLQASKGILSHGKDEILYRFEVPENVRKFNLSIFYNGQGHFQVNSITIQPTSVYHRRTAASFIMLILLFDLFVFLSTRSRRTKKDAAVILGIAVLASLPLFFRNVSVLNTGDMDFHKMRVEAVAQAIRDRQFPPRISSLWMDGYGYAVSVFYNDLFLILPAMLRLLGFDLVFSMKAYIFLVNLAGAWIACICFGAVFKNKKIGALTALSFLLAPYRLSGIYSQSTVGETTANIFLPLIAYGFIKIYFEDDLDRHRYWNYPMALGFGMAGLAGSHVLSLVMMSFLLLAAALVFFMRTFRKRTLLAWLLAAGIALLLSLYFLVPFADYYFNTETLISQNASYKGFGMIQYYGTSLGRLLSFFQSSFASMEWKLATPGLLLSLTLLWGCRQWYQTRDRRTACLGLFSLFGLFLTMDVFPWNFLESHTFAGRIMAQIQFPHRFLHIADLLLCLMLGHLLCSLEIGSQMRSRIYAIISGLNLIFLIFFLSDMATGFPAEKKYEYESLDTYATGLNYLPVGASTDRYVYTRGIISEGAERAEIISRKTHSAGIYASSIKGGTITLPVLNYPGYQVHDQAGNKFDIRSGENSRISIDLPAGFDGELDLVFTEPHYWTVSIFISFAALILMFVLVIKWKNNLSSAKKN